MELTKEFKLLVIVGAWNRNIFSKEWIKKYLLPKDDFEIEFSLGLDGSHRISLEKIRIEFHNNRINFIPRINSAETYAVISELASKIADYLPHTPVSGFGINFIFQCEKEEIQGDLIKISDVEKLHEHGAHIIGSQHKHNIKIDNIYVNLTVSTNNEHLYFDFNFHSDIINLTQFKEKIYEFPIEKLYNIASKTIETVYIV
ncbi:MAG: hypothetical protein C4518_13085 [Desulfobacteraceae bacterium]|nr:MAG: hypothetical protein C4518_13085 [Desulfobacteraceae bacterium]